MIKQFRRYDKILDRIILDEKYLFTFSMFDGFTDRSLHVDILIDYDYNMTYGFSCKLPTERKYFLQDFEELIQEKAPLEIITFMEKLLDLDYLQLKSNYWYETIIIDDIGGQQLLINYNSPTFNIHIVDGLPKEYFETPAEEHLYLFNDYLKKLANNKYNYLALKAKTNSLMK